MNFLNPSKVTAISFLAFAFAFEPVSGFSDTADNNLPNVVFILADDLGWRDLSNEGSTFYESPHIDRIANEGMKFTRGYATCQVCSPSRASLMTGKYPARLNITDWIGAAEGSQWKRNTKLLPATYNHQLPADDETLAEAFRAAGYRTFFAGKWHLGGEGSLPTDHGFEFNVGGHHRGSPPGGYFSPYSNPEMESGPKGELLPIRLGQETVKFIEQHRDEPFLAYLSFYSVHGPIQTTEKLWKKYRDKATQLGNPPDSRFLIDRTTPVRQVQDNPLYAGMVESMDDAVGIVLSTLDRLNLSGGKGRQWEGGIREPFYIKWPGSTTTGQRCDTPVIGTDLYPTLLELAGLPLRPDQHLDGISLVPLLKGQTLPARPLFWHYPHYGNQGGEPSSIITRGHWKLIHYLEDQRYELYDIERDISEKNNVIDQHPEIQASLSRELKSWIAEMDARQPIKNPNFDEEERRKEKINIRDKQKPSLERQHSQFLKPSFKPPQGWWEETGK